MNINFQDQIPADFSDNSRVWIYQSDRPFTDTDIENINYKLSEFLKEWNSHGSAVMGFSKIFFNQFIVVIAGEENTTVGGCSTDSLFRFIKSLENDFNITLTDRLQLAFIINGRIELLKLEEINLAIEDTLINGNTLYFNNTILTKAQLMNEWIIPLYKSWLVGRLANLS